MPWGISESAFNARDLEQTYQYSSFGVPGLGLKRGLSEDVVIAPYATALAAMVDPQAAVRNFARLAAAGAAGRVRLPRGPGLHAAAAARRGSPSRSCSSYMAHHQGMALVALGNVLNDDGDGATASTPTRSSRRPSCCSRSACRATSLVARPRAEEVKSAADVRDLVPPVLRRFTSPARRRCPRTHLLSNGRYAVMVTAAGSGYSRWRDIAVTRWREDVDPRSVGQLPLPARHADAARCGRPATSRAAPRPTATRSTYSRGPRRVHPPRRLDLDDA